MKSNGEFEIGDKVRVIKGGYGVNSGNIGKETIITEISPDGREGRPGVITRDFRSTSFNGWIQPESFELVTPAITFQDITVEERKAFIKSIAEQLYSVPTAYSSYKQLNDDFRTKQ